MRRRCMRTVDPRLERTADAGRLPALDEPRHPLLRDHRIRPHVEGAADFVVGQPAAKSSQPPHLRVDVRPMVEGPCDAVVEEAASEHPDAILSSIISTHLL